LNSGVNLRRLRGLDNFVGLMDTSLIMTEEGWKVSTETGEAYTGGALGPSPHPSRLFVFLRREARDQGPATLPSEAITVHDVAGRKLSNLCPQTGRVDHQIGYLPFCAPVAAGTYRLRVVPTHRDVAISVPTGRAAQVFVADRPRNAAAFRRALQAAVEDPVARRRRAWSSERRSRVSGAPSTMPAASRTCCGRAASTSTSGSAEPRRGRGSSPGTKR